MTAELKSKAKETWEEFKERSGEAFEDAMNDVAEGETGRRLQRARRAAKGVWAGYKGWISAGVAVLALYLVFSGFFSSEDED